MSVSSPDSREISRRVTLQSCGNNTNHDTTVVSIAKEVRGRDTTVNVRNEQPEVE
jgi:hypothetical protein